MYHTIRKHAHPEQTTWTPIYHNRSRKPLARLKHALTEIKTDAAVQRYLRNVGLVSLFGVPVVTGRPKPTTAGFTEQHHISVVERKEPTLVVKPEPVRLSDGTVIGVAARCAGENPSQMLDAHLATKPSTLTIKTEVDRSAERKARRDQRQLNKAKSFRGR